jgi:Tol biopolymer transport system component
LKTVPGSDIGSSFRSALSPEGRYLAFSRMTAGTADLWFLDIERGVSSRFTSDPGFELSPVWSPDGKWIAYFREGKQIDLVVSPFGRKGPAQVLFEGEAGKPKSCWPQDWSRDGRFLLCERYFPDKKDSDLWAIPINGDRTAFPVVETTFSEANGQFSPDGRWVAYQSDESGRREIWVQSFPDSGRKVQISSDGGVQVRWRRNGNELFYLTPDNRLIAVPVRLGTGRDEPRVGMPVPLFQTHVSGNVVSGRHYHVSQDGQQFLVDTLKEVTSPITVLLNWHPGLAARETR